MKFAEVAIALPIDGLYTYAIPEDMPLRIGHAVLVPFGRKKVSGYVVRTTSTTELSKVKAIARMLDREPVFDEAILPFFQWIARYYLSGLGEVIATALPSAYRAKSIRVCVATEAGIDALAAHKLEKEEHASVLREVIAKPNRTQRGLGKSLHGELTAEQVKSALSFLSRKEWIRWEEKESSGPKSMVKTVTLSGDARAAQVRGGRMKAALNCLEDAGGTMDLPDILAAEGPTIRGALKRLESKGMVCFGSREDRSGAVFETLPASAVPFPPNAQQAAALKELSGKSRAFLLHGVTGSGKTEVYLQAAAEVLEDGKQALILVPEIALTPLLIGRVKARFGDNVAALHSGLRPSERLQEWRKIRAGEVQVAVGARSALFAPFERLGLIVVDEEHDDSYKQGDGVRYSARDLAVVRGLMEGCPVVLGSATPSMESWHNAMLGKYGWIKLTERATPRCVPEIQLVDMRGRPPSDLIATEVQEALRKAFSKNEQAIVLYNRRGYAPTVECSGCGAHYSCPSCGVSLVYHRRSQRINCHYCGFYRNYQRDCPECSTPLDNIGYGTERVEEDLKLLFPAVSISRMDADTTSSRGAHHRILEAFRRGETQLLVGTQLVAKGHDFPNVTVAAVVGVDHILTLPDFRSAERTFSLVTQLAGRAGRGDRPGKVLVQTRHPEHFAFGTLNDTNSVDGCSAFYQQELRQREILRYPPSARLLLVKIEGADRQKARNAANQLCRRLRSASVHGVDILGPTMAPMSKLVGRWRFQLILRGSSAPAFRSWIEQIRPLLRGTSRGGVRFILDVDPRNLL
jgi:primosomal protein N' (replication factor Y) (superfamily II helicase)